MEKNLSKKDTIMATIAMEGGYVNDPDDPGGETNMGITHITWAKYGDSTALRNITIEQAIAVYDKQFYQKQLIDDVKAIFPSLANNFFDASVNCGRCGGTKILQKLINGYLDEYQFKMRVTVDGYIGQETLDGLNSLTRVVADEEIENDWRQACIQHYKGLVKRNGKLIKYLKGWINRVLEVY